MVSPEPSVWDYLFVTPDAYTRIFDLPYQIENFNTYHQRTASRLFHFIFVSLEPAEILFGSSGCRQERANDWPQ